MIDRFGHEPSESTKYRLPLAAAILVVFGIFLLFQSERGLDDVMPFAFGILLLFNSLGDKLWARNVKAAAWLRLAANAAAFLGIVAFLIDLYLARDWIWLTAALILGLALIWFFVGSSRDSTSD